MKVLLSILLLMCLAVAVNGCSTDAECSDGKVCIDHAPDAIPNSCGDRELPFDCKKNDDCPSGYVCAFVNDFLQQRCVSKKGRIQ